MSIVNFKHQLYEQIARVGKALSTGNRLELMEFLTQTERSVESLAKLSGMSIANTSHHLRQLREAGLVLSRKSGQQVIYRVSDKNVVTLLDLVRKIAESNLAEVEKLVSTYLKVKDSLEPVQSDELLKRIKDGLVIVLDVRPEEEFSAGHLPGAINIPLKNLKKNLRKFSSKKEIIAYCRGPYCVLAFDAVEILRNKGFKARRLEKGFPEWENAGLQVEKVVNKI
ncbi:MAG: metalloregulator ArsR/SmtB family transcription factor [Nitrospinota bacterium]|nr:metalloregulator ArsR/SmtB family transcription factor [Nitrospinota bacterium]